MKTILIILGLIAIFGGIAFAKGSVIKTDDGFKIKQTHTYYEHKVSWGEGYSDHALDSPITGIAVLAVGDGWTYSTVTNTEGIFKVKVKAGQPFKIHISDGNTWSIFEDDISGIAEGTTLSELN